MARENDEETIEVAARFDENWTGYSENDLISIRADGHKAGDTELFRQDADSLFLARQLDHVRSRIYTRKYPELVANRMIPVSSEAPEWAETITTRYFDEVGIAKIIANYADDLPRADVRAVELSIRVRTIGDSYGYNVNEIRASRATGVGLDTRKAAAARRAVEQKLNRVALRGDADYNMLGLFNNPNVPSVTVVNGNWIAGSATGSEIVADMNAMYIAIINQSNGIHRPNYMALPPAEYAYAASQPLEGMPGQTAMSFFRQQHPEITIDLVFDLKGLGSGGTNVMYMYERSEENLRHELVMPFNQLPMQVRNLEFVVPCMARTAGVWIDYPLAFAKMEGI